MDVVLQAPKGGFVNRDDMARRLCPGKICAEVGVLYGSYSKFILAQKPARHFMVDCWKHQPDSVYPWDDANLPDEKGEAAYQQVRRDFGNIENVTIIRAFSFDGAQQFVDKSLDFCFLDGCHTTPMLLADCVAWWPKIKPGGWLCGHDYNLGDQHAGQVHNGLQHFLNVLRRKEIDIVTDQQDSWGIAR